MPAIPPSINSRLYDILTHVSAFESNVTLHNIFTDQRLSPWRDRTPDSARNRQERIQSLVEALCNQYNPQNENALILFLHALVDQTDPGNKLHGELKALAHDIDAAWNNTSTQPKCNPLSHNTVEKPTKPWTKWVFIIIVAAVMVSITGYSISQLLSSNRNHLPVIHSFTVSRQTVKPGEIVTIVVNATDEDADPLSYIWSANRGIVPEGNQGPRIEYVAPTDPGAGIDIIRVTITDSKGGTAKEKSSIAIEYEN